MDSLTSLDLEVLRVIDTHPECTSLNVAVCSPADERAMPVTFVDLYSRGYIDGFPITTEDDLFPVMWEALVLTDRGRAAIS